MLLTDLEDIEEPVVNEELYALLDNIELIELTAWEYDFIMDISEREFISKKQSEIITVMYNKYIDY